MKIIDTYESLCQHLMNHDFHLTTWQSYANAISLELAEKCLNDAQEYDYETELLPVLNECLHDSKHLEALHNIFLEAVQLL